MSQRDRDWMQRALMLAAHGIYTTHPNPNVGCVLVDVKGRVLSTGYNGRARGLPNCNDEFDTPTGLTMPFACPNSDAPAGEPNGCESIHAEQNALLQCKNIDDVHTAYVTIAPCLVCVKMLMNTGCQRIVFEQTYAYPDAERLWRSTGREWLHLPSVR